MSEALATIRNDENLREALGELYAGDGQTYADRLDAADSLPAVYELLIDAAAIATMSGDYVARDSIREAAGRHHAALAGARAAIVAARVAATGAAS